jgi:hypothetical protein
VKTVNGSELPKKYLSCLATGETPTFAAWLESAMVNGAAVWKHPLLLLSTQRLIICKERTLGTPNADFAITWPEVSAVKSGPWRGSYSPLIQLDVQTRHGRLTLPVQNIYAVDTETAIRVGYLGNHNQGS